MRTAEKASLRRLPAIQQDEIAECGLACLAMIACYYGHDIDLPSLRRRFPVSLKGASLARLITVAGHLGLETRALRAEIEHLHGLRLPCILHWDLNHYVVLKQIKPGRFEIHDPARGVVKISESEFGRHFTGVALEVSPRADFRPIEDRQRASLRQLAGDVRGLKRAAAQILLLAIALEVLTLLLPLALQWTIDIAVASSDLALLHLIALGFLIAICFQATIAAVRGWVVADLGASLGAQWITNLFGHLIRLPLEYFEKRSVGSVLSRFVSVQSIQQTVTGSFIEALLDGFTATLVLFILALYSAQLTLLIVASFGLYALLRWVTYSRLQELADEQLTYLGRQQSQMIESIEGIQTIKLANKQDERRTRLANVSVEVANREAEINRLAATFSALSKLIFNSQRIVLIWLSAWLVLNGKFSVGVLVVFISYAELFAGRGSSLIDKLVQFRLLGMHAKRIADITLEAPERSTYSEYIGRALKPRIEVRGISFRYSDDDPWVLRECSFTIDAGECVALVGPSGCGKSTLAKILLGLLRPTDGAILIDGVDIEHLGLASYRELCSAVMQEDALFAGSIADNISFFAADASMEKIEAAARAAHIHDDIVAMPMGYESLVGDMGSSLSGGQKQRVLLARALYRNPSVLLLDEATSHLDVTREHAINRNIAGLSMTRIVIAHRPETIRSADRIIALEHGRIVESGRCGTIGEELTLASA